MEYKKLIRDFCVVAAICGGFYLLTMTANLFSGEAPPKRSEYSLDRQQFDVCLSRKDYRQAVVHLERMVDSDPFNGHAWYWLGVSANQVLEQIRDQNSPDAIEVDKYASLAISSFEKAQDYPRYRNLGRFHLAAIYVSLDRIEDVIANLTDAVEDGFYTRRGLANYDAFSKMKDNDDFKSIVSKELINQRRYAAQRRGNVQVAF